MRDDILRHLGNHWLNADSLSHTLTYSILPKTLTSRSDLDYIVSTESLGDTKELFFRNIADESKKRDLIRSGWCTDENNLKPILYRANSRGFRCDHFTDEPSLVFFGCSFTYGTGMHEDDIWPTRVSKHFDLKCCNLGIPAQNLGPSSLYTTLLMQDDIPNAKAFIIKKQAFDRITFFMEGVNGPGEYYSWNIGHYIQRVLSINDTNKQFYNQLVRSVQPTSEVMDFKDLSLIISYAEKHNIPIIFADNSEDRNFNKPGEYVARDYGHPGMEWHDFMTSATIKQLESILS